MSKTIILDLNNIALPNKLYNACQALQDLDIGFYTYITKFPSLMNLHFQHKRGELSVEDFCDGFNELYRSNLTSIEFWDAWKTTASITQVELGIFKEVLQLINQGVDIRIIGDISLEGWDYILEQLREEDITDKQLEILKSISTLSFEKHLFYRQLLDEALKDIPAQKQAYFNIDSQPTLKQFNWLNPLDYITYPFQYLTYRKRLKSYKVEEQELLDKGVELFIWDPYWSTNHKPLTEALESQNLQDLSNDRADDAIVTGAKILRFSQDVARESFQGYDPLEDTISSSPDLTISKNKYGS